MKTIYVLSGGFDPLHSGHINMFKEAHKKADIVIVGVNSDSWLIRKKGKAFLPLEERLLIVGSNKYVTTSMVFDDTDNTACDLLEKVKLLYPNDKIIFGNGGDRTKDNIPEMEVQGITFEFTVGGDYKKNSSSSILENFFSYEQATRIWGEYFTIFSEKNKDNEYKLKKLIISPNKNMSKQLHCYRDEIWILVDGEECYDGDIKLELFKPHIIKKESIHQFINKSENKRAVLIELQYGQLCNEYDIKRYFD